MIIGVKQPIMHMDDRERAKVFWSEQMRLEIALDQTR